MRHISLPELNSHLFFRRRADRGMALLLIFCCRRRLVETMTFTKGRGFDTPCRRIRADLLQMDLGGDIPTGNYLARV